MDVSVYGRDASDAQLLAKTSRFLFYRSSGPTLALTRRQQVEHEAYLTLMAERSGARVPAVLAAGPAGPAHDAVLVTRPPPGIRLAAFVAFVAFVRSVPPAPVVPPVEAKGERSEHAERAEHADDPAPTANAGHRRSRRGADHSNRRVRQEPAITDPVDDVFDQLMTLHRAGIAHGSLSARPSWWTTRAGPGSSTSEPR
jgi:hypothetical protein